MKVTKIVSGQIGAVRGRVQTKKVNSPDLSFKRKTDAAADDSNISWGGILFTAAAVFAVTSTLILGIKKLTRGPGNLSAKIPNHNLPDVALKLDTAKLRELPLEVKRQAKQAVNDAVTHQDYQQVLRDFNIGK